MKCLSEQRYLATMILGAGLIGLIASPVFGQGNPLREAYFGETHVHTSWSLDAWMMGNRITDPGDAYKYFKGETIKHPLGYDIKIDTPMDFAGVTDHSEYVGVMKLANDPSSPISKNPAASPLVMKNNSPEEVQRVLSLRCKIGQRRAGRGARESRDRAHDLGAKHRTRGQGQRTGQVHHLLQL